MFPFFRLQIIFQYPLVNRSEMWAPPENKQLISKIRVPRISGTLMININYI